MDNNVIHCPGGTTSQSGVAGHERYSSATIQNSGEYLGQLEPKLELTPGPHIVPIWNSHQGSITAVEFIWKKIEESGLKIYDMWAKRIEFWHLKKTGSSDKYNTIGSVKVAKTQCSKYIETIGKDFIGFDLTNLAFEAYHNNTHELDGVLIAPQPTMPTGYERVSKETANPNNFTTFINFVAQRNFICRQSNYLTAVTIKLPETDLGSEEQTVFRNLFDSISHIDEIPKLIFIINRTDRMGLIFEGQKLTPGDLLGADQIDSGNIRVYEEIGTIEKQYSGELKDFFDAEFPILNSADFILHTGVSTCMFACPILGIYTHGYEINTVEPIFRFYISQFFQAIEDGIKCSDEQDALFRRHESAWKTAPKKSEYFAFTKIQ